jgi:hypothetical protein
MKYLPKSEEDRVIFGLVCELRVANPVSIFMERFQRYEWVVDVSALETWAVRISPTAVDPVIETTGVANALGNPKLDASWPASFEPQQAIAPRVETKQACPSPTEMLETAVADIRAGVEVFTLIEPSFPESAEPKHMTLLSRLVAQTVVLPTLRLWKVPITIPGECFFELSPKHCKVLEISRMQVL